MASYTNVGSLPAVHPRWRPTQRPCSTPRFQGMHCRAAASSDSSSGSPSTSGRGEAAGSQRSAVRLAQQAAFAAAGLAGAVAGASAVSALFAPGPAGAATQAIGESMHRCGSPASVQSC